MPYCGIRFCYIADSTIYMHCNLPTYRCAIHTRIPCRIVLSCIALSALQRLTNRSQRYGNKFCLAESGKQQFEYKCVYVLSSSSQRKRLQSTIRRKCQFSSSISVCRAPTATQKLFCIFMALKWFN